MTPSESPPLDLPEICGANHPRLDLQCVKPKDHPSSEGHATCLGYHEHGDGEGEYEWDYWSALDLQELEELRQRQRERLTNVSISPGAVLDECYEEAEADIKGLLARVRDLEEENGQLREQREFVFAANKELGSAWRNDWSDFDGRTLRSQLEDIESLALEVAAGTPRDEALVRFRSINSLCEAGHGCWTHYEGCFTCNVQATAEAAAHDHQGSPT